MGKRSNKKAKAKGNTTTSTSFKRVKPFVDEHPERCLHEDEYGKGNVVFDDVMGIYKNTKDHRDNMTLAQSYFEERDSYWLRDIYMKKKFTIEQICAFEPLYREWMNRIGRGNYLEAPRGRFIEGLDINTGEIDKSYKAFCDDHVWAEFNPELAAKEAAERGKPDVDDDDDDEYEEETNMSNTRYEDDEDIKTSQEDDDEDDDTSMFGNIGNFMRLQRRGGDKASGKDTLRPTASGKKQLASFKRSKKSPKKDDDEVVTDSSYRLRDSVVHCIDTMLEEAVEAIKDGKLNKAYDGREWDNIDEFIDAFSIASVNDSRIDTMAKRARILITIAKSFYEYDDKQRSYITNSRYDELVAKYLELGNTEPTGIVPKGSKIAKKTRITYPSLHNNMDKAYIINSGDPIPTGVKERTSIESFLIKCYKEIGVTSEKVIEVELSPKIDGVSVNGTTVDDMLTNPQTRGDESESVSIIGLNGIKVGEDEINDAPSFGIQYECFVTEEDRVAASDYLGLETPYASCRHAAAGIIQRLSTGEDDGLLEFLSMYPISSEKLDGTYAERMDFIQNYAIVPDDMIERKIIKGNMNKLIDGISHYFEKLGEKRSDLSYAIDGLVITIVDEDYQDMIGRDGRTNKYQIALKFDPASAEAKVSGIFLDTGSKGFRTIQVELEEPVYLDGVRYDHVPVLSAALFENLELREGSKVAIHRVGDVIPSISVIKAGDGRKLELPNKCPQCGHTLKTKAKKLYCSNPNCVGNIAGRLHHMISGLDIPGYSIEFAKSLVRTGNALNLADLFTLNSETLANSGLTGKRYFEFSKTLKLAIAGKRDFELLSIMGVPEIGGSRAKDLLSEVGGFKSLIDISESELERACEAVKGLSDVDAVVEYLNSKVFRKEVSAIAKYIDAFTDDFDNLTRVGHTGGDLTREAKDLCRKIGFDITDGKRFDILIVPTKNHKSAKVDRANKKGIPVMTVDEFMDKYQN